MLIADVFDPDIKLGMADPLTFRRDQLEQITASPQGNLCTMSRARSVSMHSLARLIRQHR
ncbi:hypothetical protein AAU01_37240 [Paenarthrobacter aurescens]|uniref:Uncharacterized protein n=1 Tax=Paenarthrobacter aurescens TaxID=43663 RepID=A0A4Y3NQD2_PAEAU|nr:hypothetical protein AAU01_37240 [Paenarthrobacter aurescens]